MNADTLTAIAEEHELMAGEPKCEANHIVVPCSGEVTHRNIAHRGTNLCHNAHAYKKYRMYRGVTCSGCMRPASDCWRFIPI